MPNAARLLNRIEKQAKDAIDEAHYAHSYEPGSVRFDQAIRRGDKAERNLARFIEQLRALLNRTE